jgi:LytTr DNA-binding domain
MRFWQFTIRQWAKWKLNVLKRVAIEIFVSLIIGVVFGLFGPFGTFSAPLGLRVLYWVVFIVAGYTLFRPTLIVSEWLADHIGMSIWIAKALAIGVASLPMTLLVAWMLDGFQIKAALTSNALPYFYGQVVLVSLIVNFIYDLLFTRHPPDRAIKPPAIEAVVASGMSSIEAPEERAFHSRLPIGFGPVLALSGEDHYVRVHGRNRSELILVRLRDAISEMGEEEGLQVHRSWWVARAAVANMERSGRAYVLILSNGLKVTASRDGRELLEAKGWA